MNTEATLRSKAVVAGLGCTPFGVFPEEDAYTLGAQALGLALADAGMARSEIDALIVVRIPDYQRFSQLYGIDPGIAFALAAQGRMSGLAMELGASIVASGAARNVAIVYGNDGRSTGARYGGLADRYSGEGATHWFPYGMTSPGAAHAMMYAAHSHQYGTSPLALANIAVTFREHAALNPAAVFRKPITIEDHQSSRFIAEPFRLYDYCQINDGGVALILARAERARDLPHRPVYVRGVEVATRLSGSQFPPADYWHAPMRQAARSIYAMAGLGPDDMDGLMIYDNFSATVLFALEGFGYCAPGESGPWVCDGNLSLRGRYPANTHGGHLSESYMQGFGHLAEAVRQIRGDAGDRQIPGAHNIHYLCAAAICSSVIFSDSP